MKIGTVAILGAAGFIGYRFVSMGPKMSHESLTDYMKRVAKGERTTAEAQAQYKRVSENTPTQVNALGSFAVGDNIDLQSYIQDLWKFNPDFRSPENEIR